MWWRNNNVTFSVKSEVKNIDSGLNQEYFLKALTYQQLDMLASTTSCRLNKLHMRRFSKAHCCEVFAASSRTHPGRQQAHREESTAIWASEAWKPQ